MTGEVIPVPPTSSVHDALEDSLCRVSPSPELRERMRSELAELAGRLGPDSPIRTLAAPEPTQRPGLNDGLIIPGDQFPLGTPIARVRRAALDRAPLRDDVRVIVVLVDFDDLEMTESPEHFEELFFSTGVLPHGSVKEYFTEASNGLINIVGEVVGPYRLPETVASYAGGDNGIGTAEPNARTMARHAAEASDADVDFGPYDNDGNGFVDAFIVVHAGPGGEQTGRSQDIWSHKWVLAGGEYQADAAKIFAYLTVPEDSKIGVCAHELGHLIMGWPDLYDANGGSEGIGNWCLMAGGSWNAGGDVPAHPSAWCKITQEWVTVQNQTSNESVDIDDVKDSQTVYRLWKNGEEGQEYFLVENRQKRGYDAELPGEGLLIWHVDDSIGDNTNDAHYKVALVQADGKRDLEGSSNRGDAGDAYPGSANNAEFSSTSTPNSKSYGGVDTSVAVKSIPSPAETMSVDVAVQ